MLTARIDKTSGISKGRRPSAQTSMRRQAAERRGRVAELVAGALLMLKGYRILDRRHRGPFGEIDVIAVRGHRLAFVEVKQRRNLAEAESATSARQAGRLSDAAERWLWRHPHYREYDIGLDVVVLGPSFVPRHLPNGLNCW